MARRKGQFRRKARRAARRSYGGAKKIYRKASMSPTASDLLAIGIYGVARNQVTGKLSQYTQGAGFVEPAISDELALGLAGVMLKSKKGLAGKIARVAMDHEGVRVVAYYAGTAGAAKGGASWSGLW